ncbi:M15 family metallopeptidase [Rathayibacter oskolensis]|nr:M15 family metallopeptidase [Rathayibacter oskolensis]WKK72083.1 M15 family metallopeptidase [Rathayibacter oskolensis]
MVVNKLRTLSPVDYVPADLVYPDVSYVNRQPMRQATADALVPLFAAASSEAGLSLAVQSAYRSYDTQVSVYAGWVSTRGQAGADATSARPGHSEHQTGWAVDVVGASGTCALEICWGDTPEGSGSARTRTASASSSATSPTPPRSPATNRSRTTCATSVPSCRSICTTRESRRSSVCSDFRMRPITRQAPLAERRTIRSGRSRA